MSTQRAIISRDATPSVSNSDCDRRDHCPLSRSRARKMPGWIFSFNLVEQRSGQVRQKNDPWVCSCAEARIRRSLPHGGRCSAKLADLRPRPLEYCRQGEKLFGKAKRYGFIRTLPR